MKMKSLPCCYLPSKIVFLDDNQSFLEGLTLVLPADLYRQPFTSPFELIKYVDHADAGQQMINRCFHSGEDVSLTATTVAINLDEIYKEIYNPHRFELTSAMISDYVMPGLNGIDVCRKLAHLPIRKILLTGAAGTDLAVAAFNEGIIHQFLLKDSPDFSRLLIDAIEANQQQYFQNLSSEILAAVTKTTDNALNCLQDPAFIEMITEVINQYQIVEYYLLDTQGSFLMLDKQAKPYWLIVRNEAEMHELSRYAQFEGAPQDLIDKLGQCTHAPFLFTESQAQTPPTAWAAFMQPMKKIQGDQGVYYSALITDNKHYSLDQDKILSYADFLTENEN